MKKTAISLILILLLVSVGFTKDLQLNSGLNQDYFNSASREVGVALSFTPMSPAEPLGITGFDAGAELILTDISDNKKYIEYFFEDNDAPFMLPVPRLHIQKGLPFNIDLGAMYSAVPNSNIKLWGVELKYAILEGGVTMPAVSIRGSFSKLEGVNDLSVNTQSADILISKGFLFLTPYAGLSMLRINVSENSKEVNLEDVHETIYRGILGLQVSPLPLFTINAEVSVGEVNQYGLKVGLRF